MGRQKAIMKGFDSYVLVVAYKEGKGWRVRFWVDTWCGEIPFMDLFLDFFTIASNKKAWVSNYVVWGG